MALELKLSQKLSQSLVMTPQLQQAIKLLQLGRLDYLEAIEKEVLENPVLEAAEESSSELPAEKAPQPLENSGNLSGVDSPYSGVRGKSGYDSEDKNFVENIAGKSNSLIDFLMEQVNSFELEKTQLALLEFLVGNLNKDGYLEVDVQDVAERFSLDETQVAEAVQVLHTLEPAGIGARGLSECLLIQLDQRGLNKSLAAKIIEGHLGDLESQRFDKIAKELSTAVDIVYDAVKVIRSLEPRPARNFHDEEPNYIVPDIYVQLVGNDYVLSLNDFGVPKVSISAHYQRLLEKAQTSEEKSYLQDKIKSASWLLKVIDQRASTIYKVTDAIFEIQRDFLEKGVSGLKPLVLREVADSTGLHESTISRVTSNKYVHTPQGVYELKYFFSSKLNSDSGEVSAESVKQKIKNLVSEEDPKKPLSDQKLSKLLASEGIEVARRTVAKYREQLGILQSTKRKKLF